MPSRFGAVSARYLYWKHSEGASTLAVVFPGNTYTLQAPVVYYASKAAFETGADVLGVEYGFQANRQDLTGNGVEDVVQEVRQAFDRFDWTPYSRIIFIGKSIGTVVQQEIALNLSLPVRQHIFLTPLRRTVPAIRQVSSALVIVGDRDPAFSVSEIKRILGISTVRVHIIPGANHDLEIGDVQGSIDVLQRISAWCGEFCRALP